MTTTAGTRRLVLVVDDDERIRDVVRTVLEADGFEVAEAADGGTALRLLGGESGDPAPRVVVLDVMMPGVDGIEVCRRVDQDTTKVLMLTARDDADTRDASEAAGADAFLSKPFSAVELLDAIEQLAAD